MPEQRKSNQSPADFRAPTAGAILKATGIALAVALVLLFTVVLPAEYGIDPLKTGKALGLTNLSKASQPVSAAAATPAGASPTPAATGIYTEQPAAFKVSSEDLALEPGEGVEIKYHMQKGAGMVYSWKADANVQFEFHGEPDQKPTKDYFESYELDDETGKNHSYGSFTAPSTGIHGWFWENKGHRTVMIHLTTAGFYDSAKMYSDDAPTDLTIEEPE
jgi:hypothetical protein